MEVNRKYQLRKVTCKKCKLSKGRQKKSIKVNYFDRCKQTKRIESKKPNLALFYSDRVYFDCETFEQYSDKNNPDELPIIIPYLIGWCINKPSKYTFALGIDATERFLEDLTSVYDARCSDESRDTRERCFKANLVGYNILYDIHAIRPRLVN